MTLWNKLTFRPFGHFDFLTLIHLVTPFDQKGFIQFPGQALNRQLLRNRQY